MYTSCLVLSILVASNRTRLTDVFASTYFYAFIGVCTRQLEENEKKKKKKRLKKSSVV